jgi:hypothetical protein
MSESVSPTGEGTSSPPVDPTFYRSAAEAVGAPTSSALMHAGHDMGEEGLQRRYLPLPGLEVR